LRQTIPFALAGNVVAIATAAGSAIAAAPSDCPRVEDVSSELQTLMSAAQSPEQISLAGQAPAIEVTDLGTGFRVTVSGRAREYKDEARDCARRARVAAVFVAVALGPPISSPAPAPPTVVAPVAPPRPRVASPRPTQLELGVGVESALSTPGRSNMIGPALRVAVGTGAVRFVAGMAVLAPGETSVAGVTVRQWHVPVDAGLRVGLRASLLDLSADLTLAAGPLFLRAPDLAAPRSDTVFEWGARAGVTARYQAFGRLAPFASAGAQLVADPAELHTLPGGVIGRAPAVWIGARAGISVGL
jgi:hypothetical protein